jgi:hypothetical protein
VAQTVILRLDGIRSVTKMVEIRQDDPLTSSRGEQA